MPPNATEIPLDGKSYTFASSKLCPNNAKAIL